MPKVSVLLPARDAAPWVEAALGSLLRQTERDLEIVAVDDGSSDDTGDRIARAARADRRVRLVRSPAIGLPAALELARTHARGAFVARQDADDVSHPRRLERQLARLRAEPDLAVVGARVSLFPAARVSAGMARWASWHNALLTHEAMANDALVDSVLCHGTALFRAAALAELGGWRDGPFPEDVDLWIRLLARGMRMGKVPRTLYAWRQRADSATRTDPRYGAERFRAVRRFGLSLGLLRHAPATCTLVGVGTSLEAWRVTLSTPRGDWPGVRAVTVVSAARPSPAVLARLAPPVVLVFGARAARERWRSALLAHGLAEGEAFSFVA